MTWRTDGPTWADYIKAELPRKPAKKADKPAKTEIRLPYLLDTWGPTFPSEAAKRRAIDARLDQLGKGYVKWADRPFTTIGQLPWFWLPIMLVLVALLV